MRTDDKRKLTSRLNALKSTGPKIPEVKRCSAFNFVTQAAYIQEFILPGEELSDFQLLMDTHLETWKPTNIIEETFVFELVTTLWRLRRQANLVHILMRRMNPVLSEKIESVSALDVVAIQTNCDGLNEIDIQGRRLRSQYKNLTQQLRKMRRLFPPMTPEPTSHQPQSDLESRNEPVETKLKGSIPLQLPLSRENRVHDPHSILYAALPPIPETETPVKSIASQSRAFIFRKGSGQPKSKENMRRSPI